MENTCDDDDDHLLLLLLLLLPQDVLIQILVLLPVISLLRFKSVCKSWRALIQSSFFIDLQINTLPPHNNSSYSSKFGTFIFQTSYTFLNRLECGAFMLSADGGRDDDENKVKLEHLCFPTCYKVCTHDIHVFMHEILMVGSWNGLICLHDKTRRDVSLWNPATRQFRLLPKSLTLAGIGKLDEDFVAFGYDVKTKDYKVVQISCFRPYVSDDDSWLPVEGYTFRVQVYSLSTDSWRVLEGINSLPALPYQTVSMSQGVYLNGSFYFLGTYFVDFGFDGFGDDIRRRRMILSFDFTKEIFTTMQHPDEYHLRTLLTYFGEKLAVFAQVGVNNESDFQSYDIWVLNEHDVKESWTKVHSIGPYFAGMPRGISNNGEIAFITTYGRSIKINGVSVLNYKLQLFNLDTKEVKEDFHTVNLAIRTNVYKQSLVSVGGNGTSADKMIGGVM